ncbi:MAG: amidohydrolase [Deltaproteobacteria bacterium]|nr:amidohydrolase [Deltaproteobacteria bacterium]MBW2661755.1 amidohydrolase [Deltaproteobacteria bacterium]
MKIDFHTHIFPKEIRENREKYFPSEPAFKLLYGRSGSKLVGAAELIDSMDSQGVDRSVIFGFPWKNSDTFKKHNDYIIKSAKKYPGRLTGFCCIDIFSREAIPEVMRCLESGLSGVGELALYESSHESGIYEEFINRLEPVMEICLDKNIPVLIHTNEPIGHQYPGKTPNTFKQIYRLITKFPENKIVLAHWGGGIFFFSLLKKEVRESFNNVYFDTAASPFLYDAKIYRIAVNILGYDKIIFGSDFPLLGTERYFKEFKQADLSKEEIDSICGRNAVRLLNLIV